MENDIEKTDESKKYYKYYVVYSVDYYGLVIGNFIISLPQPIKNKQDILLLENKAIEDCGKEFVTILSWQLLED